MIEHPIIFSSPMVKAILEGRKTQTRRVLATRAGKYKGQQPLDILPMLKPNEWVGLMERNPHHGLVFKCRYGQVGDRLWVREAFGEPFGKSFGIIYRADHDAGNLHKWKPSIHMFRKDSRITLEITEVRVERVQDISFQDARAEGILTFDGDNPDPANNGVGYNRGAIGLPMRYESTTAYMDLWDSINGKKHPWESNPFVWCISFKKEDK